jgi:hypothetical protein
LRKSNLVLLLALALVAAFFVAGCGGNDTPAVPDENGGEEEVTGPRTVTI